MHHPGRSSSTIGRPTPSPSMRSATPTADRSTARYRELLAAHGLVGSMSRRGNLKTAFVKAIACTFVGLDDLPPEHRTTAGLVGVLDELLADLPNVPGGPAMQDQVKVLREMLERAMNKARLNRKQLQETPLTLCCQGAPAVHRGPDHRAGPARGPAVRGAAVAASIPAGGGQSDDVGLSLGRGGGKTIAAGLRRRRTGSRRCSVNLPNPEWRCPGGHGGEATALEGDRLGLAGRGRDVMAGGQVARTAARSADPERPRLAGGRGRPALDMELGEVGGEAAERPGVRCGGCSGWPPARRSELGRGVAERGRGIPRRSGAGGSA